MGDLIDRQAAIEEIEKTIKANKSIHYEMKYWEDGMNCALNIIEDIPSAQPERKKGRWIEHNPHKWGLGIVFECSECGEKIECEPSNFCPNCGAMMEE